MARLHRTPVLIRIILYLVLATASLLARDEWPGVPYTEVRAFVWDAKIPVLVHSNHLIREDLSFVDGVLNPDGALLNASQVKRLLAAHARRLKTETKAGCYYPHNAFVFFDAARKPVAYLEVCFDCTGSRTVPQDEQSGHPDYYALAELCAELKLPFGAYKSAKAFLLETGWIFFPDKYPAPKMDGLEPRKD